MIRVFNEKTLIPIGSLAVVIAAASWLTTLHMEASANSMDISKIQKDLVSYREDVRNIRESLIEIKVKMGIPVRVNLTREE